MNEIQKCILDIYKCIADICDRNSIKYFAIGGACIGAVRHNGFIPWDDDMDLGVPVEQYNKLIHVLKKQLPPYYKVITFNDMVHYSSLFIKVTDTRTAFIEKANGIHTDAFYGVFVDIMPWCSVPADNKDKFTRTAEQYLRWNAFRRNGTGYDGIIKKSAALALKVLPYNYFSHKWYSMIKKYPLSEAEFTGYVWSIRFHRLVFPASWFADTIKLPFEDTFICCPVEYDKYLTAQFGDYMQLPPESERTACHPAFIDLNTPYSEYKKHPERVIFKGE